MSVTPRQNGYPVTVKRIYVLYQFHPLLTFGRDDADKCLFGDVDFNTYTFAVCVTICEFVMTVGVCNMG